MKHQHTFQAACMGVICALCLGLAACGEHPKQTFQPVPEDVQGVWTDGSNYIRITADQYTAYSNPRYMFMYDEVGCTYKKGTWELSDDMSSLTVIIVTVDDSRHDRDPIVTRDTTVYSLRMNSKDAIFLTPTEGTAQAYTRSTKLEEAYETLPDTYLCIISEEEDYGWEEESEALSPYAYTTDQRKYYTFRADGSATMLGESITFRNDYETDTEDFFYCLYLSGEKIGFSRIDEYGISGTTAFLEGVIYMDIDDQAMQVTLAADYDGFRQVLQSTSKPYTEADLLLSEGKAWKIVGVNTHSARRANLRYDEQYIVFGSDGKGRIIAFSNGRQVSDANFTWTFNPQTNALATSSSSADWKVEFIYGKEYCGIINQGHTMLFEAADLIATQAAE